MVKLCIETSQAESDFVLFLNMGEADN